MIHRLTVACLVCLIFTSFVPAQNTSKYFRNPEVLNELLKIKHNYLAGRSASPHQISRLISKELGTFSFNELVNGPWRKMDNRWRHVINQMSNALAIGFLDAVIKAGYIRNYGSYGPFMRAQGPLLGYANIIAALQVASALEYALAHGNNLLEVVRFFLAQGAISNVLEHIGYWVYVNSSIPIDDWRSDKYFGWRGGKIYPTDPKGNNDVPWMSGTAAGYISRWLFGDPPGVVRDEAILTTLGLAVIFSYFFTPDNSGRIQPNQFTNFDFIFYLDGVDKNKITGFGWGAKLGLKYNLPFAVAGLEPSISFYQSPDLDARTQLAFGNSSQFLGVTMGTDEGGNVKFFGGNLTLLESDDWYCSLSYEKISINEQLVDEYMLSVGYRL